MLFASVTIATSFMRPLHFGHSRRSIATVLRRRSAQSRYLHPLLVGAVSSVAAARSTLSAPTRLGVMRARHLLADASTPAYPRTCGRGALAAATLAMRRANDRQGRGSVLRGGSGKLGPEATVLRIDALTQRGDRAAASAMGDRFLAAHPHSPYADRVRSILSVPKGAAKDTPSR